MFKKDLLKEERILITGGGSGIGAEMALHFALLGADIVICGRREKILIDKANEISIKTNANVTPVVCDIRNPDLVSQMIDDIWRDGRLTSLVNNAAATFIEQTDVISHRAIDAILATTLHGTIYCTHAVGRKWIKSGNSGAILNILSTSVRTGRAFTVPSSIAKSGVLAMIRSLAVEWSGKNIRLVGIEPGPFVTSGSRQQLFPEIRSDKKKAHNQKYLARQGDMSELTSLAAFLLSSKARFINGESIAIDGAAHLKSSGADDLLQWSDEDWKMFRKTRI